MQALTYWELWVSLLRVLEEQDLDRRPEINGWMDGIY